MNPNIAPYSNYDPLPEFSLIQPLSSKEFTTYWITSLYREEQLTSDEYIVLDFIGLNGLIKSGIVIVSFQGMKRLTSLHQAKLTKAINRLVVKDLLQKLSDGYALTDKGYALFNRLFKEFNRAPQAIIKKLYSNVSSGQIQGPTISESQQNEISNAFVGRWFGKYRFISKIQYRDSFEIFWISTDGSISTSLLVGSENELRLSLSAPIQENAQKELQLLIDHVSHTLETVIDAPVIFNSHSIYLNNKAITQEIEDISIHFAG